MPKPKHPGGRPPHVPTEATRQQVTSLILFGLGQAEVSTVLGISEPTLVKYYRDEIDTTKAKVGAKIASGLARLAMKVGEKGSFKEGALTAAIFYLKTQGRWREVNSTELSGPGGAPIPVLDLSKLSDKELAAFERLAGKVAS